MYIFRDKSRSLFLSREDEQVEVEAKMESAAFITTCDKST